MALTLGALAWGAGQYSRAVTSLEGAIELADAGKLAEAESRVRARLAREPDDDAARILLAQFLLKEAGPGGGESDRDRSGPAMEAFDLLQHVRPEHSRMASALFLARGNALDRLSRLDEAESSWLEALRVDTLAPEAGWNLLHLYYLQWREDEARRLALRLFDTEPDPHDRALLLVELLRHDARPPAPGSLVKFFEPVVRARPGELHAPLALGVALTRAGQVDEGIAQLRRVTAGHPLHIEAWDGLLTCLDETGQVDVMEDELERLPAEVGDSPRMLKHRARIAQGRRWSDAVGLYERARAAEPYNRVVEYRLSRALRHVGRAAEADRIQERLVRRDVAIQELRPLYDRVSEAPGLGSRTHLKLYQEIAQTRERMQLPEEARAWHQLVLQSEPDNAVSVDALSRLGLRSAQR
jgi:tetratricopeptide (TPR) repeat protein